jgi:hypothetical protein
MILSICSSSFSLASTSKILPEVADPVPEIPIAFLNIVHGYSLPMSGVRIRAMALSGRCGSIRIYGDALSPSPRKE